MQYNTLLLIKKNVDSNSLLHGLVIAKSLNYVDEQWKKIIQLGKKS